MITSKVAAGLIEVETGRRCTRQNLEKLCRTGALRESPCVLQRSSLRLDGATVVAEYMALVAPHQAEAIQPAAKERPAPPIAMANTTMAVEVPPCPPPADGLPSYTESRARREREGELQESREVKGAMFAAFRLVRDQILAIPPRLAPRLAASASTHECYGLLMEELRRVLVDMANQPIVSAGGNTLEAMPQTDDHPHPPHAPGAAAGAH